jgi:hypothetical protein
LKKQNQFVPGLMGVTAFVKGCYSIDSSAGDEENKAKPSQFDIKEPVKGAGKREELPTAANSST